MERKPKGKMQITKEVISVIKRDYDIIEVLLLKGIVRNRDICSDKTSKRVVNASKKKNKYFHTILDGLSK